jgi:tRNA(Ile)-lysidine synthase
MMHRFVRTIYATIQAEKLVMPDSLIIVACSGGADSLALLYAMTDLCYGTKNLLPNVRLHIAHLNHGLRNSEGIADAAFADAQAGKLGLPITIGTITESERASWQGSIEASARNARYHFLREVAQTNGATHIALGHTLDDQAETILMHFIRGSSIDGLTGMRTSSGDLIRPMLGLRRKDTESYCQDLHLEPRQDYTNKDLSYTRNRVRLELLPLLETYSAGISERLARNAEFIAADADYLNTIADCVWPAIVHHENETNLILDRPALSTQPFSIRARLLRRAILSAGSAKPDAHLDGNSIKRLDRVIMDRSGETRRIEMSTGVVVTCNRTMLMITKQSVERGENSSLSV